MVLKWKPHLTGFRCGLTAPCERGVYVLFALISCNLACGTYCIIARKIQYNNNTSHTLHVDLFAVASPVFLYGSHRTTRKECFTL